MDHDAGGRTRFPLELGVYGSAFFHDVGNCRRTWLQRHRGDAHAPYALWIGMNPSVAGHEWDDPTCRREWIWTSAVLGLDRYVKCNVGDYCLTDSRKINALDVSISSEANRVTIACYARDAEVVVFAHGVVPKVMREDVETTYTLVRGAVKQRSILKAPVQVVCLGRSLDGSPRHPLYLRSDTPFETFDL